jgi:hypothetical protein
MTTTYTFEQLKEDVRKEAEALRVHATKEERRKLDCAELQPAYGSYDVYGQMTGHCYSMRAAKLIYKCSKRFFKNDVLSTTSNHTSHKLITDNLAGEKVEGFINGRTQVKNPYYSAIEVYTLLPEANNASLISYLRGETETLDL